MVSGLHAPGWGRPVAARIIPVVRHERAIMTSTRPTSLRPQVHELEGREVPAILFGVTPSNQLVEFDSANAGVLLRAVPITGFVSPGEVITDIDVRPGTAGLYGHSNLGRLLLIDPVSGFALPVSNTITQTVPNIGMDFDPAADRLRILTNRGENLVLDASLGTLVRTATPLSYAPGDPGAGSVPHITGAAFTNNVPNATSRTLFGIDHVRNTLVQVGPGSLNDGVLTTVGDLGINVTNAVGFDIAPQSNVAFAALQKPGQGFSKLFIINTATGKATWAGKIGGGIPLNDIAVDTNGTSGFVSTAGFNAFPPAFPGSGFTVNTGFGNLGFNTGGFNNFGLFTPGSSFNLISPFGTSITTTNLFPTLTQPVASTLTSPFFMGSTFTTNTTSGTGTF